MIHTVQQIAQNVWDIILDSSFYILAGFLLGGILHIYIPTEKVRQILGKKGFASVVKASLIGLPLPLCSCGVVPTAYSLRQKGANREATLAFLIATPETGIDSVALSYALLDPLMTVYRPIGALITAIVSGTAELLFGRKDAETVNVQTAPAACTSECLPPANSQASEPLRSRALQAIQYAFGNLLGEVGNWLMAGIILAGLVGALVPESYFERYQQYEVLSLLAALLISIPLYICSSCSTPIAAMLILKGISPGAAFVLIIAGSATNVATIIAVGKMLGKRSMLVYLACIFMLSLSLGLLLNWIYQHFAINIYAHMGSGSELIPQSLRLLSALVFLALMLNIWHRTIGNKVFRR